MGDVGGDEGLSGLTARFPGLGFGRPAPGVLLITLRSAGKAGAQDPEVHGHLADVWPAADRDPETRVIVITGEGRHFSAGGDLASVQQMTVDPELRLRVMREAGDIVRNIISCSKPVISAVNGTAVGAGLSAALLADISVVARSALLIDGHTRLGVAAGDHAVLVWPLLCGLAKAKYHLLTCRPVTAEEGERMGLISLCVDDDAVLPTAMEIATELAAGSQMAIRWTKSAVNGWLRLGQPAFEASLAYEFMGFGLPDAAVGVEAAIRREAPRFPGPAS